MSPPLDQHRVAQIEVSIVCTEGLVSTWYVPSMETYQVETNPSVQRNLNWSHTMLIRGKAHERWEG
jgi:hypothetical protein